MARMDNTPDDWGSYWTKCSVCGTRYHMSEGGCDCAADKDDDDEDDDAACCDDFDPPEPDDYVDDCPMYYDGTGRY